MIIKNIEIDNLANEITADILNIYIQFVYGLTKNIQVTANYTSDVEPIIINDWDNGTHIVGDLRTGLDDNAKKQANKVWKNTWSVIRTIVNTSALEVHPSLKIFENAKTPKR